jgi:hypothetical protein
VAVPAVCLTAADLVVVDTVVADTVAGIDEECGRACLTPQALATATFWLA